MIKTMEIECTGYSVVADWHEGKNKSKLILVLPGFTSTRAKQQELTAALVEQTGASALVIDYSGHGDSPFELRDTRPAQHFLEVICTFDWLTTQYPDAQISVIGSSYGSFLGTQLTKYRAFDKLVLRAPAIYKPNAFYDLWAKRIDNGEEYDIDMDKYRHDAQALSEHPLLGRASKFQGKVLVVVHEKDVMVPIVTTDAYIKAFKADVFVAEGFSHSLGESQVSEKQFQAYHKRIADWLKRS